MTASDPTGSATVGAESLDRASGSATLAIDVVEVAQLVLHERQSRDRGWWNEWAECFAEDSVIDMSWFRGSGAQFVEQTRTRSNDGVWGRHRLSPPTVRVDGDRGWAELPLGIEFAVDVNGVEAVLVSYCRSQYRARRAGAEWRIARITSIYERDSLTAAVPGQTLDVDPREFAGYRSSYRALAWYLARIGVPTPDTLLGDDQPEPVDRHYRAEHAWLHHRSDV